MNLNKVLALRIFNAHFVQTREDFPLDVMETVKLLDSSAGFAAFFFFLKSEKSSSVPHSFDPPK